MLCRTFPLATSVGRAHRCLCTLLSQRCRAPVARRLGEHARTCASTSAGSSIGSSALAERSAQPSVLDAPKVMRPGDTVDIATVIRNWWSFPAVGFNSILEMPVHKFEVLHAEDVDKPVGSVVVPNSIFGLPIRKDIIFKVYWWHRRKLAGYCDTMQLYKWEWPGANRKFRTQKKSGKGRMGRRKAPGRFDGVHSHALRPRDWGKHKINKRSIWKALKHMLSVKFAQNSIKVVDSFNLQSHKTKHLVQHLRRLLGRRCHSALLIHEGHLDINDNCRWASAHIPAIRRENVEGVSVYNLLKYHEVVITEMALAKLIKEIQIYPKKRGWGQRFATPDGKPAPVPEKVDGWNHAWVEKKERLRNSDFRAREFFKETQKWKWTSDIKGPLKVPRNDPMAGFRVKDFLLTPEKPIWEKLESLYGDDEPLDEDPEEEEFDELVGSLDALQERSQARKAAFIESPAEVSQTGLRQLAEALDGGAAGFGQRPHSTRKKAATAAARKSADDE
eukprot:TRINITY_DN41296_c0_g1_i1.p1 TRINITY_DN41296_c0_g1~~TRINITY_DN41296_c0_g1_i1.p1  ORF type:complete len:503 (+),score=85.86 TRINITY_DN41296_c0_g1_i1:60-1568(+)